MARTKASVGAKISSGKSNKARCNVAPTTSTGVSSGSSDKASRAAGGGGNPVCPRETPKWQRPITNFFINKHNDSRDSDEGGRDDGETAGSSKSKPKRNVIESSDEETPQKPKNAELDETIELETLTGENSHKIEEYYSRGAKGKGVGKRTKEKSNGLSEGDGNSENKGREENIDETEGDQIELDVISENKGNEGNDNSETKRLEEDIDETEENGNSENKGLEEDNDEIKGDKIELDLPSESEGKENIDYNIAVESEETSKAIKKKNVNNNKERSKREREDQEEGNVSKKIKIN